MNSAAFQGSLLRCSTQGPMPMNALARRLQALIAMVALCAAGAAAAQENLEKGKTPAQLYASDCATCHQSPRGLSKGAGGYGLENFLRAHYTASRESAAALAAYLRNLDRAAPSERDQAASKKKSTTAKPALPPRKPGEGKSSLDEGKAKATERPNTGAPKAEENKPAESKSAEPKPAEPKPAESKSAEPKPAGAKSDNSDKPN
jgi:mono/diheme cytochrome c family protein